MTFDSWYVLRDGKLRESFTRNFVEWFKVAILQLNKFNRAQGIPSTIYCYDKVAVSIYDALRKYIPSYWLIKDFSIYFHLFIES